MPMPAKIRWVKGRSRASSRRGWRGHPTWQIATVPPEPDSLLAYLVGEELGSVVFVPDYRQLDFDGPRRNCYVWARLVGAGGDHAMGQAGYRDAPCALIGSEVTGYRDDGDAGVVLTIDGTVLAVEPPEPGLRGFEIAELHLCTGMQKPARWAIWVTDDGLGEARQAWMADLARRKGGPPPS